jgi:hypothetical protein
MAAAGQLGDDLVINPARLLAGTRLGADLTTGTPDDEFEFGLVKKLTLKGSVSTSVFSASVNPGTGGTFGDGDDTSAGGLISSISINGGADAATLFLASVFPRTAKIGGLFS